MLFVSLKHGSPTSERQFRYVENKGTISRHEFVDLDRLESTDIVTRKHVIIPSLWTLRTQ